MYFNASDGTVDITIPSDEHAEKWEIVVDTAGAAADSELLDAGAVFAVTERSLVVLRAHDEPEVETDHSVAASLTVLAGSTANNPPSTPPSEH